MQIKLVSCHFGVEKAIGYKLTLHHGQNLGENKDQNEQWIECVCIKWNNKMWQTFSSAAWSSENEEYNWKGYQLHVLSLWPMLANRKELRKEDINSISCDKCVSTVDRMNTH